MCPSLRLRRFSPIDREYSIYEIVEDEEPLLNVGLSDDGVVELGIHPAASGKVLPLRDLKALIPRGRTEPADETELGMQLSVLQEILPGSASAEGIPLSSSWACHLVNDNTILDDMGELDGAYLRSLEELRGIGSYRVLKPAAGPSKRGFDARLRIRTAAGARELLVQQYRSHLTHAAVDHLLAAVRQGSEPVLILAPYIGGGVGEKLIDAGLNYLDARGNCHIDLPPLYIHVEGRSGDSRAGSMKRVDKGIRSAGYEVLFAYLAAPELLDAPVRTVAAQAGVSRQPVSDMRRRLLEEDHVFETRTRTRWHPRRRQEAMTLWLHGYSTVVRPSLLWGVYRTQETDPEKLEATLARVFSAADVPTFRWGGTAAGYRLTGHYRGERTVVHLREKPSDLSPELRALSDPRGNLVLMGAFGEINWELQGETVHPLLVYSEMLQEGTERAAEAAQELYDERLSPLWEGEA